MKTWHAMLKQMKKFAAGRDFSDQTGRFFQKKAFEFFSGNHYEKLLLILEKNFDNSVGDWEFASKYSCKSQVKIISGPITRNLKKFLKPPYNSVRVKEDSHSLPAKNNTRNSTHAKKSKHVKKSIMKKSRHFSFLKIFPTLMAAIFVTSYFYPSSKKK